MRALAGLSLPGRSLLPPSTNGDYRGSAWSAVFLLVMGVATLIPHGQAQIAVALRYRPLVPLFLTLIIVERGLMAVDGWFLKGAGGHHPPEHFASVVAVVLAAGFLVLSLPGAGAIPSAQGAKP